MMDRIALFAQNLHHNFSYENSLKFLYNPTHFPEIKKWLVAYSFPQKGIQYSNWGDYFGVIARMIDCKCKKNAAFPILDFAEMGELSDFYQDEIFIFNISVSYLLSFGYFENLIHFGLKFCFKGNPFCFS